MRIKKVKNDLATTLQFGQLAQALQEISVIKMADIRSLVLKAREYEEGLTEIFADIRLSTKGTKQENETIKLQAKFNKRVVILLSANNKLFGHITDVVYTKCMEEVLSSDDDLVIVGKIGKQKYERDKHSKRYTYYELPDYDITFMDILPMLSHIVEYKSIRVYYALSTNIMNQEAVAKNITGEDIIVKKEQQKDQKLYLLEPSAEALYSFFTGQIIGIFFKQTIYEYELARHASRIKTLEESINHVEENKRKQGRVLSQLVKVEKERRQQMQNMYLYVRKRYG